MLETVLLILGVPAIALLGVGTWALKRESRGAARAAGYLLVALGAIPAMAVIAFVIYYVLVSISQRS